MLRIFSLILFLCLNTVVGGTVAVAAGFAPVIGVIIANGMSLLPSIPGVCSAKLTKEIWLADLMQRFYPNTSFLSAAQDMSQFVDNDKLNFAEIGADPNVLINNNTYPVPYADRTDTPLEIILDTYDTEGTVLRNADVIELAYDKRASVLSSHKNALLAKFAAKAAHAYAPSAADSNNFVLPTSGTAKNSFKSISFGDILDLKTAYDAIDAPADRVLVLNPQHYNQLAKEDLAYLRAVLASNDLFGFKLFTFSKTPTFNKSTGAKVAFGAAAAPTTDTIASFSFIGSEVMKAQGTFEMFERLRDPEQKGDIINFQMRAIALPKRNKYAGAIYSVAG